MKKEAVQELANAPQNFKERLFESRLATYNEAKALHERKQNDRTRLQMNSALRDVRELQKLI